jgi:hypothetical protein
MDRVRINNRMRVALKARRAGRERRYGTPHQTNRAGMRIMATAMRK